MNLDMQRMMIHYQDFHNVLVPATLPGTEPLYNLDATVMEFFISFWY